MTTDRCPSCSLPIPPGQAMPSPVPELFPVMCEGCAMAAANNAILIRRILPELFRGRPADDPDVMLATCH